MTQSELQSELDSACDLIRRQSEALKEKDKEIEVLNKRLAIVKNMFPLTYEYICKHESEVENGVKN